MSDVIQRARSATAGEGSLVKAEETLARVDAAIDGRCPCGADPAAGSAYCGPDCEPTHVGPDTDAPWLGGPHAARWRPDLVAAFDESALELIDRSERSDTGLAYTVYSHRTDRTLAHLRVDDGHRFVGMDVPWVELEADGPSEPFRRLERELSDARRLDPDPPDEDDAPPCLLTPHLAGARPVVTFVDDGQRVDWGAFERAQVAEEIAAHFEERGDRSTGMPPFRAAQIARQHATTTEGDRHA